MSGSDWRPSPAQEQAEAHGEGTLRIMAGAGSGKTTALVRRILRLLGDGRCRPGQLLMLTFTNQAVADMRSRYGSDVLPPTGRDRQGAVWGEELAELLREAERLVAEARAGQFAPTPGGVCACYPYGETYRPFQPPGRTWKVQQPEFRSRQP